MKATKLLYTFAVITIVLYLFILFMAYYVIGVEWDAMWILGPLGLLTIWVVIIFIREAKRPQKLSNDVKERYISPNKDKS